MLNEKQSVLDTMNWELPLESLNDSELEVLCNESLKCSFLNLNNVYHPIHKKIPLLIDECKARDKDYLITQALDSI